MPRSLQQKFLTFQRKIIKQRFREKLKHNLLGRDLKMQRGENIKEKRNLFSLITTVQKTLLYFAASATSRASWSKQADASACDEEACTDS